MIFRSNCDPNAEGCKKDKQGSTFLLIRHILFFIGIFYNMILYVGESLMKIDDEKTIQSRKKRIDWKSFKSITNNATVNKIWKILECIIVGLFCFAAPVIRVCYQFAKNKQEEYSWKPVSLVKAPSRTRGSDVVSTGSGA